MRPLHRVPLYRLALSAQSDRASVCRARNGGCAERVCAAHRAGDRRGGAGLVPEAAGRRGQGRPCSRCARPFKHSSAAATLTFTTFAAAAIQTIRSNNHSQDSQQRPFKQFAAAAIHNIRISSHSQHSQQQPFKVSQQNDVRDPCAEGRSSLAGAACVSAGISFDCVLFDYERSWKRYTATVRTSLINDLHRPSLCSHCRPLPFIGNSHTGRPLCVVCAFSRCPSRCAGTAG